MDRTDLRLELLGNGYTPLMNLDKITKVPGWQSLEVTEDVIRRWGRSHGNDATGLRLDNGIAVFDFDVNAPEVLDLYDALEKRFPRLLDCPARGTTASPKEAWLFRTDEPFGRIYSPTFVSGEEGLTVEIFGGASPRQFGAFGPHDLEKGSEYVWRDDVSPANVPLDALPVFTKAEVQEIRDFCTAWLLKRFALLDGSEGGENLREPIYDLTDETVVRVHQGGEMTLDDLRAHAGRGGYTYCSASFCDGPIAKNTRRCSVSLDADGGIQIWDSMTDYVHHEARFAPRTDEGFQSVAHGMEELGLTMQPAITGATVARAVLRAGYILTDAGGVRQNEANLAVWLESEFEGAISGSDFDQKIWIMEAIPGLRGPFPRTIIDDDINQLARLAQHDEFPSVSPQKVRTAVAMVAAENRHNGPRDYLQGLTWDGAPRLDSFAETYFGTEIRSAEEGRYVRAAMRKWLISAVARILRPGCKADHLIVLQGDQGLGKSAALSALGGPWFSDDMPPVGTKDAKEWLRGKWIAEIAELGALRGRDIEHVKSFITTRIDSFRKSYGMVVEDLPRQCVFAGSTNDDEYLIDMTGNRRFWPIRVASIDLVGITRDRNQIWAEAVAAYRAGEHWHLSSDLDPEAVAGALEAQEEARSKHPDEERIRAFLQRQEDGVGFTSVEICTLAFPAGKNEMTPQRQHHVPRIITKLGWRKGRKTKHGYVWTRGPKAEPYKSQDTKTVDEKVLDLRAKRDERDKT